METLHSKKYTIALERVRTLRKYYQQIFIFVAIFGGLLLYHYLKTGNLIFRPSFIFSIWGLILVIKGIKLFIFNTAWERRQIEKELHQL